MAAFRTYVRLLNAFCLKCSLGVCETLTWANIGYTENLLAYDKHSSGNTIYLHFTPK